PLREPRGHVLRGAGGPGLGAVLLQLPHPSGERGPQQPRGFGGARVERQRDDGGAAGGGAGGLPGEGDVQVGCQAGDGVEGAGDVGFARAADDAGAGHGPVARLHGAGGAAQRVSFRWRRSFSVSARIASVRALTSAALRLYSAARSQSLRADSQLRRARSRFSIVTRWLRRTSRAA